MRPNELWHVDFYTILWRIFFYVQKLFQKRYICQKKDQALFLMGGPYKNGNPTTSFTVDRKSEIYNQAVRFPGPELRQ